MCYQGGNLPEAAKYCPKVTGTALLARILGPPRDRLEPLRLPSHGTCARPHAARRCADHGERCELYLRMGMFKEAGECAIAAKDGDMLGMVRSKCRYRPWPSLSRLHGSRCMLCRFDRPAGALFSKDPVNAAYIDNLAAANGFV